MQHWRYCKSGFAISHREQSIFSLHAVCRQPRAEFKQPRGVAPLTATGGHYPALLCLLYGKRARITTRGGTGRLLYWAGLEPETHSTQITQGTSAGTKGGLIRPGLGEVQRNSERERYQAWERALLLSDSSAEWVREGRMGEKEKEEEKRKSHVSSFASVPLPQGWYWLTGFQSALAAKDVLSCYELVRASKHAILFALLMYSSVAFVPCKKINFFFSCLSN